jgi:hypothetical protein
MGHKITTVPLIWKIWDIIFSFWANYFMGHFSGYFDPLKISLEMAHEVICPQNEKFNPAFSKSAVH